MPSRESLAEAAFGHTDGCLCCDCGKRYRVDVILDDDLWQRILNVNAGEARKDIRDPDGALLVRKDVLLCGSCIMHRIELLGRFGAYYLESML